MKVHSSSTRISLPSTFWPGLTWTFLTVPADGAAISFWQRPSERSIICLTAPRVALRATASLAGGDHLSRLLELDEDIFALDVLPGLDVDLLHGARRGRRDLVLATTFRKVDHLP